MGKNQDPVWTSRIRNTDWMQEQGWAYLEHVHGVVCVGQAEQQAVEDLLPAQLAHFSVTREQRQYLQTKHVANDDIGYRY